MSTSAKRNPIGFKHYEDTPLRVVSLNGESEPPEIKEQQPNLYLKSLVRGFIEFLHEEATDQCYTESRLNKKIEAARLL